MIRLQRGMERSVKRCAWKQMLVSSAGCVALRSVSSSCFLEAKFLEEKAECSAGRFAAFPSSLFRVCILTS